MTTPFRFDPVELPAECEALRQQVRGFIAEELAAGHWIPNSDFGSHRDPGFTRRLGARGWIGMTWPKRYGGRERSYLERFVITEEMLAMGAPRAAHSAAARQVGPGLLRYGSDRQKERFLPAMARGEYWFAPGMSEPQAGSDLAAIEARAEKVPNGWRLNGVKTWISWAHKTHAMVTLARSEPKGENRHAGIS